MIDNKLNKLLQRVRNNTFLGIKCTEGVISDTRMIIVQCVNTRMHNNITQKDMSKWCGVSLSKIKRFESLKVDSLTLFVQYRHILEDLPSRDEMRKLRRGSKY